MANQTRTKKFSKSSKQIKRWPWFTLGTICGAVLASYLHHCNMLPDFFAHESSNHHTTATSKKATHAKKLPQFDFYTVLKNDHKQTHESHPENNEPQIKAKNTLNQTPVINKSQPEVRKPKPIYFLQAAAVRHHNDADQLKAQLILAGYDVQVKKISKNNTIWYRVLVGPYTSKKQAENVKEKLLNHHVNAHLISRGSTEG